jgi:SAM-dependent methyltransferase
MPSTIYDSHFYDQIGARSRRSADVVLPEILRLVPATSVVDIGCGTGAWLAAAQGLGASDILGLDGDYVPREQLLIPADAFRPHDLTMPVTLPRRYDLAMSLEVGEHLPAASAQTLVASLVAAAPVVLFSAAIPGQGGEGHVNEQWPGYWSALFAAHGWFAWDVLRPRLWMRDDVDWWYRQNALLFVSPEAIRANAALAPAATAGEPAPLVHPEPWHWATRPHRPSVGRAARDLRDAFARRLGIAEP